MHRNVLLSMSPPLFGKNRVIERSRTILHPLWLHFCGKYRTVAPNVPAAPGFTSTGKSVDVPSSYTNLQKQYPSHECTLSGSQRMLQELAATTSRLVNMAQEASIRMHEEQNRVDPVPKAVLDSLTEFTVTKSNARSCPSCVICLEVRWP